MFEWSDTDLIMRDTIRGFINKEIRPNLDTLETGEISPYPIARKLFSEFGLDALRGGSGLRIAGGRGLSVQRQRGGAVTRDAASAFVQLGQGGSGGRVPGVRGLSLGGGRRWLAVLAAAAVGCGVAASATAFSLAGTAKYSQATGWVIPALHDAASDRPVPYTPVCTSAAFPVCIHPAFDGYLDAGWMQTGNAAEVQTGV